MSSLIDFDADTALRPRYSEAERRKSSGATYTPVDFAAFVADRVAQASGLAQERKYPHS